MTSDQCRPPVGVVPDSTERQTVLRTTLIAATRFPLALSGALQRFGEDPARGWAALTRAVPATKTWRRARADLMAQFEVAVAADQYDTATVLAGQMADQRTTQAREDGSADLALGVLGGHVNEIAAQRRGIFGPRRRRRVIAAARRQSRELRTTLPTWAARASSPAPVDRRQLTPQNPLRVLHVVTNSLPQVQAGSTIRTQRIVEAQRDLGWDARVATRLGFPVFHGAVGAPNPQWVDEVPYYRLLPMIAPARSQFESEYARLLAQHARAWRPDVLHGASDAVNARVALMAGRRLDIPVAYEARTLFEYTWAVSHGGAPAYATDTFRWLRAQHDEILQAADVVTTLGTSMRDNIIGRGVDPDRVHVVPNAIPESYMAPRLPSDVARGQIAGILDKAGALSQIDADDWLRPDLVVGSVSTMYAYEGFETLIEAAAIMRSQGARVTLMLVGDGPALAQWRAMAGDRGVPLVAPGRVPLEQILPFFDSLDVFAMPRIESDLTRWVTALKPLEAQARGVPVVGSDLPAVREVLASGADTAPSGDASAWATLLGGYLDQRLLAQRGKAARDWVAACRTWPRVMRGYASAYASLGYPDLD